MWVFHFRNFGFLTNFGLILMDFGPKRGDLSPGRGPNHGGKLDFDPQLKSYLTKPIFHEKQVQNSRMMKNL
jgi:hypothetical protein